MSLSQAAVLAPVPTVGRYLFYSVKDGLAVRAQLSELAHVVDGLSTLVALGPELVDALGATVPGLRAWQALEVHEVSIPSTPTSLCVWLRGADSGDLVHLTRRVEAKISTAFQLDKIIDAFRHGKGPNGQGLDLTGYEEGSEDPDGDDAAEEAAFLQDGGPGLKGSAFMVVQQWTHDLDAFEALSRSEQDDLYGRRRSDNAELPDAPVSAHAKRLAPTGSEPSAVMVQRSMPWAQELHAGMMRVSFGQSFAPFEAQMQRMVGTDDGVIDAMFTFSRPTTGAFFWCPPMQGGRLDLRHLGL